MGLRNSSPLRRNSTDSTTANSKNKKDRGAVMIEAIIVLPLVILMVLGISEFGFIFRSTITMASTSRSAARVSSNVANARGADYEALQTVIASLGSSSIELQDVEHVLIYNATTVDTVPTNCFGATGVPTASSTTGRECNHYGPLELVNLAADPAGSAASFGLAPDGTPLPANPTDTCLTTDIDRFFCPLERDRTPNPNTEYVGVWIQVRHEYFTGILPWDGMSLEDKTVMGIEPLGTL